MKKCRVCGCTEEKACPGGCYWVKPDLCSSCATEKDYKNPKNQGGKNGKK